jgi:hypothetical protein
VSATIAIKGIRFKARMIPITQLVSVWETLTNRPLPSVKAFQLDDHDFDHVMRLRQNEEDEKREEKEWGKRIPVEETDACVFNADESFDTDYIILVKENPYHTLKEVLRHELSHISKGDL